MSKKHSSMPPHHTFTVLPSSTVSRSYFLHCSKCWIAKCHTYKGHAVVFFLSYFLTCKTHARKDVPNLHARARVLGAIIGKYQMPLDTRDNKVGSTANVIFFPNPQSIDSINSCSKIKLFLLQKTSLAISYAEQ